MDENRHNFASRTNLDNQPGYGLNASLPIPARRNTSSNMNHLNTYQNVMNPFLNYGSMYPYGYSNFDNSFMSSLQPLNSAVQTINSFSTLVNSTYNALCTSVATVSSLVNQLKQSKNNLFQIIRNINLLNLLNKMKIFLQRIISGNFPNLEDLVSFVTNLKSKLSLRNIIPKDSLLSLLFGIYLICGPFIVYKYVKMLEKHQEKQNTWNSAEGKCFAAKVLSDFIARQADELSVLSGDVVTIAPPEFQKEVDWYLVSNLKGDQGLVPASHVKVLGVLEKSKNK